MRVTDSRPERPPAAAAARATPAALAAQAICAVPDEGAAPAMPASGRQPEIAWLLLWLACVVAIVAFPAWQVIPFDLIWISLALLYGFRLWPSRRTLALVATAAGTTAAAVCDDFVRHLRIGESAEQIPLLASMFVAMAWQASRRIIARDRAQIAAEAQRLLQLQRQFLQDASHQLRTPITIALGHAELLGQALTGRQQRDISVVVGELERLKSLSERLLLVATSENPGFLALDETDLTVLAADLLQRWRPTAARQWQLGQLEPASALVDSERMGLALDALVENAVRHTTPADQITVSILGRDGDWAGRIVVEDTGEGIDEADLPHIFARFRTIPAGGSRGTGLGLALVRAIAHGHGGEVHVQSTLGQGSRFEVLLPGHAADFAAGREIAAEREAW